MLDLVARHHHGRTLPHFYRLPRLPAGRGDRERDEVEDRATKPWRVVGREFQSGLAKADQVRGEHRRGAGFEHRAVERAHVESRILGDAPGHDDDHHPACHGDEIGRRGEIDEMDAARAGSKAALAHDSVRAAGKRDRRGHRVRIIGSHDLLIAGPAGAADEAVLDADGPQP